MNLCHELESKLARNDLELVLSGVRMIGAEPNHLTSSADLERSAVDDDRPIVQVGLAIVCHNGRCLVGERSIGTTLAGFAEFPGGKVEPGESPADCAIRECREETGLAVEISEVWPVIDHDYPKARVRLHNFLCRLAPAEVNETPTVAPLAAFRWLTADELQAVTFPPANAPLLPPLLRVLAGG